MCIFVGLTDFVKSVLMRYHAIEITDIIIIITSIISAHFLG